MARGGVDQGLGVGMGKDHGLGRALEYIKGGALAGVGQVHQHAEPVAFLHPCLAKGRETGIGGLQATVAEGTAGIVGGDHHAQPKSVEDLKPVNILA